MNEGNHKDKLLLDPATRSWLLEKARQYNLLSDVFMKYALDDIPACQHVLRIITGIDDLIVQEVHSQYRISAITSHDAILDVLACDADGKLYNLEIQRTDNVDHARRCRFYSAMIDSKFLPKGADYADIPEVYIIYISEKDIWKQDKAIYHVAKYLAEAQLPYDDGQHIIYVNTAIDDKTAIARLMHYFKNSNPNDMSQGDLSQRVRLIKCEKGGTDILCKVSDEIYEYGVKQGESKGKAEGRAEEKRTRVLAMLKKGYPEADIMDIFGISAATLNQWRTELQTAK